MIVEREAIMFFLYRLQIAVLERLLIEEVSRNGK